MIKKGDVMKVAICSDIHGNIEAFNRFLEIIEAEGINKVLNLGDFVRGKDPDKIMDHIMNDSRFESIVGNHDEAYCLEIGDFATEIDKKYIEWIKTQPKERVVEIEGKKILMVHSRPSSNKCAPLIYNAGTLNQFMDDYPDGMDLICFGHTHIQLFIENFYGKKILNPGSLGLAIGGKVNFAIIEIENDEFTYKLYKI
ncbi:metallophosphoesterase family protein [Clostridium saudiense]|nr:metallophosphoesterase family protein [Clostridium saudiense]